MADDRMKNDAALNGANPIIVFALGQRSIDGSRDAEALQSQRPGPEQAYNDPSQGLVIRFSPRTRDSGNRTDGLVRREQMPGVCPESAVVLPRVTGPDDEAAADRLQHPRSST
jgi:hypothetical protein